ncbi:excinuclease ABC subunit UvrC [bacterium]|jgi:excinuclease ABC subunit C|nr:excinuclease ABC subunit UvrC [bacterium]MBT3795435.1 excinuclease ABC subunit UvrC [bacterium]MBT4633998.1 excinuclease ABC subunit UvrC [bacterium]
MRINEVIIKNLPTKPGIYIFKNKENETLYVGKAKNLQKRISSYFSKSRDSRLNIAFLMKEAWGIDFTTTNSEEEALMLESKTIKIRQPKYNIMLKDDKTYASLRIELNKEFPRISSSRKCDDSKSIYLGPFRSSDGLKKTKKLFQRIFGIRDCSETKFNLHKKRACVYKNIDMCLGPCDEETLKDAYNKNISSIKAIFRGKIGKLKKELVEKMNRMAQNEQFEEASFYRDELSLLSNNYYFNPTPKEKLTNTDVVGFYILDKKIQIVILFFRGGYLIDKANLYIETKSKNINLDIYQLVSQFYSKKTSIPKKIIIAKDFPYISELKKDLSDFTFSKSKIEISVVKNAHQLMKLATDNAEGYIVQNIREEEEINLLLNNIKVALNLKKLPNKIECFDISNTQGTNPVASMVTFVNGTPDKSKYKKFKITTQGPNDYAMMSEAVNRRLNRINDKGWEPPDLILLDGGKGHLNKIAKLDLNNIDIASIAKPKKNEKIDKIYTMNKSKPADFSGNIKALNILINARNEAHRFALTFHKDRRRKAMLQSNLEESPI